MNEFWEKLTRGEFAEFAEMIRDSSVGRQFNNSEEAHYVLKPMFDEEDDVEKMFVVFLNGQNLILKIEQVAKGTINRAAVYPREVVKRVLLYKATTILLAHNHPSGSVEPTTTDLLLTKRIAFACKAIDVVLHDHLVIGRYGYTSMADDGTISKICNEIDNFLTK